MMVILPDSRRGLLLLAILVIGACTWLTGDSAIRLGGIESPGLELRWLTLLALLAFILIPVTSKRPNIRGQIAAAVVLLVLAWPLERWHHATFQTSSSLTAKVSRASDPNRSVERISSIDTLRLEARRHLHRLVSRRRDIALDIEGYLLVPKTGTHRFFLSCDDTCSLEIDDWTLSPSTRQTQKQLESGIHHFKLLYEQRGGPAHLTLDWARPAWIELLGLDHYVSSRREDLYIDALHRKEWQAVGCLVSWLVWWVLVFCLVLHVGQSRHHWKQLLTSAPAATWVPRAAAAALIVFGALLRFDAFLIRSHLVEENRNASRIHRALVPLLPSYSLLNPQNAPDDPYRADVRSYLDRAQSMRFLGFYDPSFREPFYVAMVSLFLRFCRGREIGILVQSLFFSIAVLPLICVLAARVANRWWALAALLPVVLHEWLVLEAPSGYRMSTYAFFALAFAGCVFLSKTRVWQVNAVVAGLLGSAVCLIRLSGLSLVVPIVLLKAWDRRSEESWKYPVASLLVILVLIGPFLLNCYREYGDPFYAVSFHTQFWLDAEQTERAGHPVSLSRYLLDRDVMDLAEGTLKGLTTLPIRTYWRGLAHFSWMNALVVTAGVLGLLLASTSRYRFLTVAYFAHLVPFAYIQNFRSGQMPRFVMPSYFFLVLAGVWIAQRLLKRRLSTRDHPI